MTRGKGEGSVYKRASDGLWCGSLELPSADGKRRRKTITGKSKNDVIRKLSDAKIQLRQRGDLPTAGQTVGQWLTYWLEHVAGKELRPYTVANYRTVLTNHVIPVIGKVTLDRVTPAHVRRVHAAIIEKGLSSTYALNAHRVLSSAFTTAEREGRIHRNPAKLTAAPRKAVAPQEALTVPEAIQVLQHIANDPLMGARWATSLLTGARRGEVLGLERDRVSDVLDLSWQLQRLKLTENGKPDVPADFEYRHLTGGLYLTRPKSSAGWRIVPLVDPLKSILERYIEATPDNEWGLMFTRGGGRPLDPDQDSKAWRRVLSETGIEKDVVLHGLRHTAVDLLYEAGVPEALIMEIVGHSTRGVTRSYKSRGNRKQLTEAMERMSALLGTQPSSGS